jgi:hypothetical protein
MKAKLFGVGTLVLACALLFAAGATSQPGPGGKDKRGAERVSVPVPGYGTAGAPDGDLSAFDLRQLLDELVRVRQEKAALERREQTLLGLIPRRIDAQRKELDDLEKRLRDLRGAKDRAPEGKK